MSESRNRSVDLFQNQREYARPDLDPTIDLKRSKPGPFPHHREQCWNTAFILRSPPVASGCPLEAQACGGVKQLYGTKPLLLTSVFVMKLELSRIVSATDTPATEADNK